MRKLTTEQRLERIHTAITTLVSGRDIKTISIYDVAKEAAIAPSTVYHYYPNIEALIFHLMEGVLQDFEQVLHDAIKADDIQHWRDINRMIEQGFQDYYRQNPVVQKVLLGQHTYASVRHADVENDLKLGACIEAIYRRYFELPQLPDDISIFAIAIQIADKVYSLNYRETGGIPTRIGEEAVRLTEAYLGLYLPQVLPTRQREPEMQQAS